MFEKKNLKIFLIIISIITLFIIYSKFFKEKEVVELNLQKLESEVYSSNIIKDVKYTTKDADGNKYTITAEEGEIDYSNTDIIYLTNVKALIKLVNSENITVTSKYGKYNSLTHNKDRDIIERYYSYDPDVEENADIFFHDILTKEIDWKEIGLNSLKYEATKEKIEELNYTLFQIIT